jgi:transposase
MPVACQEVTTLPAGSPRERELDATVALQAGLIDQLRVQVDRLQAANERLQARVAELEGRLGQDSNNSNRPPSSDGLRKRPRPARPREQGARDPGKQPGAPGAYLAQVPDPDEIMVHAPARCAGCGGDLTSAPVTGVQARQVFDLPEVRLRVTEHRAEQRACGCGQATWATFPGLARAAACYGPGVRAVGCYLLVAQHLPVERAARLLAEVLGAPVAAGTLAGLVGEAADSLRTPGGFVEQIREQLRHAEVANFDETGARVAGRLHWVHSASTATLTWQTVHPKRGVEAMDAAGILPGFAGVAVHDGWSPYRHYQDAAHALCGAHLLRELDAVADEPRQGWAAGMRELLTDAMAATDQARAAGTSGVHDQARDRLHARYQRLLADGHAANPPRRADHGQRPAAARLLGRLDTHRAQVLRFLDDLRVPFTNNQAERDLRMVKLQQKISGCWRSRTGAEAFLAVRSYLSTARKQDMNPLDVLGQLFGGHPWLPPPADPAPAAMPP